MNSPLIRALTALCGAALIAAVAYVQWHRLHPVAEPETAQKVDFQPIQGVLVDRLHYQITQDLGANIISTSLPVSTTAQPVAMAQAYTKVPVSNPGIVSETEGDADTRADVVPVTGAYLVKFSNSQLCDANGACPTVLAARSEGPDLVQTAMFKANAKNVWVSSHKTNGNPDLIIDAGTGKPPVRMVWSLDGQYPDYQPVFASPNTPLPPLK
jgi:hypothetical protein